MKSETEATRLLVTLLARERALFRPFRVADWQSGSTAARAEMQKEFRAKGLPWANVGTPTEQRAAQRRVDEIISAGLVEAAASEGRKTHLRLTSRGRQVAEVLTDHPGLAEAHRAVVSLLRFAPAGRLVSELLPAKLKDYGKGSYQNKLLDFQYVAMPAIVEGWIGVKSDRYGRTAYYVTPSGETAARKPEPRQQVAEADDNLIEAFMVEYEAERDRLLFARPSHKSEIGPIPLSAGAWDEVVGPWNYKPARKPRKAKK